MKPLSYHEEIGLLYEAHAAMIDLLECYFSLSSAGWQKDMSDIHLRLRLLIEDLISDEDLARLKPRYCCPFETLAGLEDPCPLFRDQIGSDRWKSSQRRLQSFQGKLTELHIRAGSPGCPEVEAYKTVIAGLSQLLRGLRFYSNYDFEYGSEDGYMRHIGDTKKVIAEIRAGFAGIEVRRMRLRPLEPESQSLGGSAETSGKKQDFKCRDKVRFLGTKRKGRNILEVNDKEVMMGDSLLILLLRLAIGLQVDPEGWVHRQDLIDEGIMPEKPDDRLHKRISDLRERLKGYLHPDSEDDFIENNGEEGYRIAVAPGNVTCDEDLLHHKTPRIARLAAEYFSTQDPKH